MNSSLDIIGSYLIGGIVVLGLVGIMFVFNSKSQETKLSQIAQYTSEQIGDIVEHDFNKLGYGVSGNSISSITDSSITFLADLNNSQTIDSITYSTLRQNNNFYLSRKVVEGTTTKQWNTPVKSFDIAGIDTSGNPTYNIANIKGINVKILITKEGFANSKYGIGAFWQRKFYPPNL